MPKQRDTSSALCLPRLQEKKQNRKKKELKGNRCSHTCLPFRRQSRFKTLLAWCSVRKRRQLSSDVGKSARLSPLFTASRKNTQSWSPGNVDALVHLRRTGEVHKKPNTEVKGQNQHLVVANLGKVSASGAQCPCDITEEPLTQSLHEAVFQKIPTDMNTLETTEND